MCDASVSGFLTKRRFLKCCALGAGGIMVGWPKLRALALPSSGVFPGAGGDDPWKWSKEALYYVKTAGGVRCMKCPHFCQLSDGEAGKCRNRVNYHNTLYSIAYGNPCAVHIDPIEKKPFFHFLPSTRAFSIAVAGCNLRCLNCQNWQISQVSPKETDNVTLMPADVVAQCKESRCESIAYTYSEPTTFYEYTSDTSRLAREQGLRNLLKSSGYINEEPLRALAKVLDAANIDLKTFDDEVYQRLSQARVGPVLRTLKVLAGEGVWLEVTNLVVPGWTDDLDTIKKMSDWMCENGLRDVPLHFSRFVPLYKLAHLPLTPVSTLEKAREAAMRAGIRYVYIGNVPGHEAENTSCHACKKTIIERRGYTILSSSLKKGSCGYCGTKIPGVWN
jgi:pyruvate formate lyase activating enzyme